MLEQDIEYRFDSEARAYRFLNTATHLDADGLRVRFGRTDHHVRIRYQPRSNGFDTTLAQLDDIARELGGEEA